MINHYLKSSVINENFNKIQNLNKSRIIKNLKLLKEQKQNVNQLILKRIAERETRKIMNKEIQNITDKKYKKSIF